MPIPFFFLVLIRFARALWRSLKDPEFKTFSLSSSRHCLLDLGLPAGRGVELVGFSPFQRYHADHLGLREFLPLHEGKIFTMFYTFIGIGTILGFVNVVAERSMEQRGEIRRLLDPAAKEKVRSEKKTEAL
jgi:hypothetical protein